MEEKRRRQSLPLINVNSFLNLQKMKSSLADLHDFRCSLSASQKKLENFRAIIGLKVTVCSHYIAIIIRKAAIHLKPLHFIHLFSTPCMLLVLFNKNQHVHLTFNPKISTFFFFRRTSVQIIKHFKKYFVKLSRWEMHLSQMTHFKQFSIFSDSIIRNLESATRQESHFLLIFSLLYLSKVPKELWKQVWAFWHKHNQLDWQT